MKNLKKLRLERNLSQQTLSEAIGLSQQTITKYENGKTQPDFQTLMTLAEFFHTSVDYLIGYTNNPRSNRTVNDIGILTDMPLTPYQVDKMKKTRVLPGENELPMVMEAAASENPNLFDTTPKERHHLCMYRKLTPKMQLSLDSFLEEFVPDAEYEKFIKKKQKSN